MFALKNVLVAIDFSKPAASALAYGRGLSRQYGASLHLFFAEADLMLRYGIDGAGLFTVDMQREIENAARIRLETLLTEEDRQHLHARTTVVSSVSPANAIVEYARANAIDLIVLGTHGRGAVAHLFIGSVAERVVRLAPCPVLTVRYPEREFLAPDEMTSVAHT